MSIERKGSFRPHVQQHGRVECTLHQFFAIWAGIQKDKKTKGPWEIPGFHIEVLDFLADYENWEQNTGVLQVFRGGAKSTIVGVYIVWLLSQDPTLRFLVLSADKKTAGKITTDVANIIAHHPFAQHLHGEEGAWRGDTLQVAGSTDGRNPSVTSWGLGSNVTGARADFIIFDDCEVPKNSRTDGEREQLRTRLDEPTHILVPGGYELFVGTPHSWDSIYPEILGETDKVEAFRTGASSLKIPALSNVTGEFPNITGDPIWPARFSVAEIQKKARGSKTKGHFLSQYLLLPYNPDDTVLDPSLIAVYSGELDIHQANGAVLARIMNQRVMGVSCCWDPSMAKLSTDDSVLGIVFTTDDGHYFLHRAVKLQGDADEQVQQVMRVMKDCKVPHVTIETNGIGNFLPAIFRKAAGGTGLTCEGKATTQNKIEKMLHAYETRLAGGYIHAHRTVMDSPFRSQLRDFNSKTAGRGKDDFIDTLAMCILAQPIRLRSQHYGQRDAVWQGAIQQGVIEAEMDAVQW